MYSEYDNVAEPLTSIEEESDFLAKSFIDAYKIAIEKKECDLLQYLAIPKIEFTEKEKIFFKEKKQEMYSDARMHSELKDKGFEEVFDIIFNLVGKYYVGKHKKFWRPGIKHYVGAIWYIIYQCIKDVKTFSKEYQINYVDDGEQRCLFNFFNLYIHSILFNGKVLLPFETRKVIFAASALHPAQDDYIDNNEVNKEVLDDIYKKLLGKDIEYKVPQTKAIFDLVEIIYNKYNPKDNPTLVKIFTKLHEWQCKSMSQKSKGLSEEELLEISFMKGGYAFAFYGYIALGEMDMFQFRHFFSMGAIFQITDDLHDIEIDIANGVETVWTKIINEGSLLDDVMYGIIGVQRKFESITSIIQTLKKPVALRRMELFAVRLDLIKFYFANSKYFSDELINNIQFRFNIDVRTYMDRYKLEIDKIKTMDGLEKALMDMKKSYVHSFKKEYNYLQHGKSL